jgi:hypothetical protein
MVSVAMPWPQRLRVGTRPFIPQPTVTCKFLTVENDWKFDITPLYAHKAEGAGGRENQDGDFHNQTKGFKMPRAAKPLLHAPGFWVKTQLDASAPPFVHGVGGVLVDV